MSFVEIRGASKAYAGQLAIDKVDFDVDLGEVHSLVGENGAGKSTLCKSLAGAVVLSGGTISIGGKLMKLETPKDALDAGVVMVYQETSLVPTMTVAQNIQLGKEKALNRLRGLYIWGQQLLSSLNFHVDPTALVSSLGAAQKQMVEIARAVFHEAKVIIFDEPTATLTPEEKQHFFDLVAGLKARGTAIIFISHALEEALETSDRITVLRDGKNGHHRPGQGVHPREAGAEHGRPRRHERSSARRPRPAGEKRKVLVVENLSQGALVKNMSLLGLRRRGHRDERPGRLGTHGDGEGHRRRHQARPAARRHGLPRLASRSATACRGRRWTTASST